MRYLVVLLVFISPLCKSQVSNFQKLTPISESEREASLLAADADTSGVHKIMACTIAANDNFANATLLTVNGGSVAGTTCGSMESGEATGCNTGITATVWYKFVATASTQYVKIDYTGGGCYFGSAIYSTTALPSSACSNNPMSCQQNAYGPATQIHQLTNLAVGSTYYIQIAYNSAGSCPTSVGLNIGVTSTNPGGFISNPAPLNTCATTNAGCYFNTPPTSAQVTSGCTGYALASSGYGANSVWTGFFQFTNSTSYNTAEIQAIISSNCFPAGNVNWFNWSIYSSGCGLLTCGTLNNLTIGGLACGGTYILQYQIELANCTSFTTIWPYQNAPATSPACLPLPLELLYFTASQVKNNITVKWQTVNEINSKQFAIEKSYDGINFEKIKLVTANGRPSEYNFEDENIPGHQIVYYRLKHITNDEKISYSKTVSIILSDKTELLKFSPNPAQDVFEIGFSDAYMNLPVIIEMYDLTGKKVMSKEIIVDFKSKTIELNNLPKGLYTFNVLTGNPELNATKLKLAKE